MVDFHEERAAADSARICALGFARCAVCIKAGDERQATRRCFRSTRFVEALRLRNTCRRIPRLFYAAWRLSRLS